MRYVSKSIFQPVSPYISLCKFVALDRIRQSGTEQGKAELCKVWGENTRHLQKLAIRKKKFGPLLVKNSWVPQEVIFFTRSYEDWSKNVDFFSIGKFLKFSHFSTMLYSGG